MPKCLVASTGKLKAALKAVGFYDVVEVAIGADLCTVDRLFTALYDKEQERT